MNDYSPLGIAKGVSPGSSDNDDDVTVVKRSLDRLGYHESSGSAVTPFADHTLIPAIMGFQRDLGLKVDGKVLPDRETAHAIGRLLSNATPAVPLPVAGKMGSAKGPKKGGPSEAQCDHLYYNVDIPVCRAIIRRRGRVNKALGAVCFASATVRYAACLRGTPMDELPPLATWNN